MMVAVAATRSSAMTPNPPRRFLSNHEIGNGLTASKKRKQIKAAHSHCQLCGVYSKTIKKPTTSSQTIARESCVCVVRLAYEHKGMPMTNMPAAMPTKTDGGAMANSP